jgi:hypothetical protein
MEKEVINSNITGIEAAYALNMCTVSISQIIDYNDEYILEQEYDSILNNLNLEKIRKHDALLNTFVEMLNTISFFRIQEVKKNMIEQQYQKRVKSALWSAIPNIGVIVASGDPITIAYSLASQIGTGYMNYRKERATAMSEKEKAEMELHITALEQFHALRRELFVTSWKLSEAYNIKDEWRLTERQIKQYNEILMDYDEIRKYERLESIQDKFEAYPPFWYYLGHTANYIAGNQYEDLSEENRMRYRQLAKQHFEKFEECNKYNILREDQLTAACSLEHIDLLLLEDKPDFLKIEDLIKSAINMSGNANDILELCAISYLKIGKGDEAGNLLKRLVNERYNTETNARLLSRLYVSGYISSGDMSYKHKYEILSKRVDTKHLFPFPTAIKDDNVLQEQFISQQKEVLIKYAKNTITTFKVKYMILYNKVLPVPSGEDDGDELYFLDNEFGYGREEDIIAVLKNGGKNAQKYVELLQKEKFRPKYIGVLNEMLNGLDELSLFSQFPKKDGLVNQIKSELISGGKIMEELQDEIDNGDVDVEKFQLMMKEYSFSKVTKHFFEDVHQFVERQIRKMDSLEAFSKTEDELLDFYRKEELGIYDYNTIKEDADNIPHRKVYLSADLLGKDAEKESQHDEQRNGMKKMVEQKMRTIINSPGNTKCLVSMEDIKTHLGSRLKDSQVRDVLAVICSSQESRKDLIICYNGILGFDIFGKSKVVSFDDIKLVNGTLEYGKEKYHNDNIDMLELKKLLDKLAEEQGKEI